MSLYTLTLLFFTILHCSSISPQILESITTSIESMRAGLNLTHFMDFSKQYGKKYTSASIAKYREEVFNKNVKMISSLNSHPNRTYPQGMTVYSDLTEEEFQKLILNPKLQFTPEAMLKFPGYTPSSTTTTASVPKVSATTLTSIPTLIATTQQNTAPIPVQTTTTLKSTAPTSVAKTTFGTMSNPPLLIVTNTTTANVLTKIAPITSTSSIVKKQLTTATLTAPSKLKINAAIIASYSQPASQSSYSNYNNYSSQYQSSSSGSSWIPSSTQWSGIRTPVSTSNSSKASFSSPSIPSIPSTPSIPAIPSIPSGSSNSISNTLFPFIKMKQIGKSDVENQTIAKGKVEQIKTKNQPVKINTTNITVNNNGNQQSSSAKTQIINGNAITIITNTTNTLPNTNNKTNTVKPITNTTNTNTSTNVNTNITRNNTIPVNSTSADSSKAPVTTANITAKPIQSKIQKSNSPIAVDWRKDKRVSRVKMQGSCGNCYSFSTTGALQSAYMIKHNAINVSYSQQQITDCCGIAGFGCNGCEGGWQWQALRYVQKNGIVTEQQYQTVSADTGVAGECQKIYSPQRILNDKTPFIALASGNVTALYQAVSKQPVSVGVDASFMQFVMSQNSTQIFSNCSSNPQDANHAMLVVGFDENGNWILKNSWGEFWGDGGFIKIKGGNTCGVSNFALYPVLI